MVLQVGVGSAGGAANDTSGVVVPSARVDADRDGRGLQRGRELVEVLGEAAACCARRRGVLVAADRRVAAWFGLGLGLG